MVDGEARGHLDAGRRVELGPLGLVRGILIGYLESSPYTDVSQPHLRDALEDLVTVFHAPSLEIMLLDCSATLREDHGPSTWYSALQTAMAIVPRSALIKSDFIAAASTMILHLKTRAELGSDVQRQICADITQAYGGIDLRLINPDNVESIVFWNFVALAFLKRESERDSFLQQEVVSHIRNPALAVCVKHILERDAFDLQDVAW